MKRGMNYLALIGLLFTVQNAQAVALRFVFKATSSGPNIYACNAGILTPSSANICYIEGTKNQCTPGDLHCVCSSTNGGDHLMNTVQTSWEPWHDGVGGGSGPATSSVITSEGAQVDFNKFWTDTSSWDKILKELEFNFSSELYNAGYFVDICYRGPQIEFYNHGMGTHWATLAQVTASDFSSTAGVSYSQLSGLKVRAFMTCDYQGVGTYKYAHNGALASGGTYDTSENEANFIGPVGEPTSGGDASLVTSGQFAIPLVTSVVSLINNTTHVSTGSYRFCKVRYVFTETDGNKVQTSADGPNFRKWQRHGAEMLTYTEINQVASPANKLLSK